MSYDINEDLDTNLMKINDDIIIGNTNYNLNDIVLNQDGWKGTVLYSNPNPSSGSSITMNLSSGDWDFLEIYFKSGVCPPSVKVSKDFTTTTLSMCGAYGGTTCQINWRTLTKVSNTQFTITNSYHYMIKSGSVTWDANATDIFLPVLAIGYKRTNPVEK